LILIYLLLFLFGQNVQDVNSLVLRAEVVHQYKSGGKGYIDRNSIFIDTLGNVLFDNNELFDDTGYKINWYNPYINKFIIYSDGADTLDRALKQTFIKDIPEIKYGFMELDGTITAPFFYTYDALSVPQNPIIDMGKSYSVISNSGIMSNRRKLAETEDYFFEAGTFLAKKNINGLYGLLDQKGQFILQPQFKSFKAVDNNRNWVIGETEKELIVFDGFGKIIISITLPKDNHKDYEFFYRERLELSCFYFPYSQTKLIKLDGTSQLVDHTFSKNSNGFLKSWMFSEDVYITRNKDDKYGLIDKRGSEITEIKYDYFKKIDDGLGNTALLGYQYISVFGKMSIDLYSTWNEKGELIIPPQNQYYGVVDGLLYFRLDSLYGVNSVKMDYQVFDIHGKQIKRWQTWDRLSGIVYPFSSGLSMFRSKNKILTEHKDPTKVGRQTGDYLYGFVNTNEKTVIPPMYATINSFGIGFSHSVYKRRIYNSHRKNFAEVFLYRSDDSKEYDLYDKYLKDLDEAERYDLKDMHHYVKTFMNKKGKVIWKPDDGLFYSWEPYPTMGFFDWLVHTYKRWLYSDFVQENPILVIFGILLFTFLIHKIRIPQN